MVRDMLRLAFVAVLAELDADGEGDEVSASERESKRHKAAAPAARRSSQGTRVRNWRDNEEIDWLFVERAE